MEKLATYLKKIKKDCLDNIEDCNNKEIIEFSDKELMIAKKKLLKFLKEKADEKDNFYQGFFLIWQNEIPNLYYSLLKNDTIIKELYEHGIIVSEYELTDGKCMNPFKIAF